MLLFFPLRVLLARVFQGLTLVTQITVLAQSVLFVIKRIQLILSCSVHRKWSHFSRKTLNSLFVVWCLTMVDQHLAAATTQWRRRLHHELCLRLNHWSKLFCLPRFQCLMLTSVIACEQPFYSRIGRREIWKIDYRRGKGVVPNRNASVNWNCSQASSIWIDHLLMLKKKIPVYRKRLVRRWRRRIANGKHLFPLNVQVENFDCRSKVFLLVKKFPDGRAQSTQY